nr:murein transglycosylase A [Parvularcula mediterranea]
MPVSEISGFQSADLLPAARVMVSSCHWLTEKTPSLGTNADWQPVCDEAATLTTEEEARTYFETRFDAVKLEGGEGLVTGYFEPVFNARTDASAPFTAPVLARPDDLVAVDLGSFRDDLSGRRIAGRVENGRLVPYADREEIDIAPPSDVPVLGYMQPDDLFFLQIQGSGVLDFGEKARRIGYAAQNGHPYKAIGKTLVEEGHMPLEEVTMQSIRQWLADASPEEAARVRATNPSYVFFIDRGEASGDEGPLGTAAVPLTTDVSVAVDRTRIPLGAPVFLQGADEVIELNRLTIAQDTGGAIRGPGRVDLFLGRGDEAGETAGRLKLETAITVLIPKTVRLPGEDAGV